MTNSALSGGIILFSAFAFGQIEPTHLVQHSETQDSETVTVAEAPGNGSTNVTLGDDTEAVGNYSIAIGPGASASQDNTMVLGGDSEKDRVSVGIGTSIPNSLASLELGDKDKGILINRLTDEQAEIFELALGMGDEGMMIYNTSQESIQTWNGVEWKNVSANNLELKDDQLDLNGSTVDLSDYQQDLKSATLNGKQLTIEIENGQSVSVDLSPLFKEYDDRLAAIESRLAVASNDEIENIVTAAEPDSEAKLYQNFPNPFNGSSTVKYFIPEKTESAFLVLQNSSGKIMLNERILASSGNGEKSIIADNFTPGVYYLSLYVNRKKVDSISMVIR